MAVEIHADSTTAAHAEAIMSPISAAIASAAAALGDNPLTEERVTQHIRPLFSRVLQRSGIYLANHSLGRPLDQTAADLQEFADCWYRDMDDAWGPWSEEHTHHRARCAALLGLPSADCIAPKTAAGQGLRAVINALKSPCPRIVTTRGEFDSCDFILKAYHARQKAVVVNVSANAQGNFNSDSICKAITPTTDLVLVSHVFYATGQCMDDLQSIVVAAHRNGALVMVDTYHSLGVMPLDMMEIGADFAIGGAYKYARGGPGACYLAIHPRHLTDTRHEKLAAPIDTGWFAKKDTFKYDRPDQPLYAEGGDAWLESTPPVATWYQARAGLQFLLAMGVKRLRDYNVSQQTFLADQLRENHVRITEMCPRGAFLLVPHSDAHGLAARLSERGVQTDARLGHVRLCPDVLTTRQEMSDAARIIHETLT